MARTSIAMRIAAAYLSLYAAIPAAQAGLEATLSLIAPPRTRTIQARVVESGTSERPEGLCWARIDYGGTIARIYDGARILEGKPLPNTVLCGVQPGEYEITLSESALERTPLALRRGPHA